MKRFYVKENADASHTSDQRWKQSALTVSTFFQTECYTACLQASAHEKQASAQS